ncbi:MULTISPECIES: NACHT domain-containing protein [unclassified Roseofilum]|uniref:NACHT domain-containing protein n=1 Tax=unclassified Roseofilum TaxID=2620099 RepID=UPI001B2D436A|nr:MULTISPECIES: GUN4 domain-containing protein [unclassified Roseofilum]MBP0010871.1 GUN4 domain-containing protein [Roseofilum sp. Belize Diploria]MBP0035415.1 GUN4 domain-containing protein [Roseofilum sp. Belize BBD 4]
MTEETREEEQEEQRSESVKIDNASARQWIRGPLLTFVRWMPLGATGGPFIAFLLQQEWLMAVLLLPVNAVSVAWGAYSESFLIGLAEIYEGRGKEDAKGLINWIDRTNKRIEEAIQWQLAGVDEKYLTLQGNTCQDFKMEGFKPGLSIFTPLLNEVFVPLGLSNAFIRNFEGESLPLFAGMKWNREKLEKLQEKGLQIWEILKQAEKTEAYRRLAIISWGGYGKTTLLRHITYIYTEKKQGKYRAPKLLPVLLLLRHWQSAIVNESQLTLPQLIEEYHIPQLPGYHKLQLPPNWARNHLRDGKLLVMIDGFDEVKEGWRTQISEWIGKEMSQYPQAYFIVTSRPSGYKSFSSEYKLKAELFIQPFNRHQQERFIQNWYGCQERYSRGGRNTPEVKAEATTNANNLLQQLEQRPELNDLAKIPLLLNLIVNVHRSYPGEKLPKRRSELYREVIGLQLGNRPLARNIDLLLPADETQKILQRLALYMVLKNEPEIDYHLLYYCINALVTRIDASVDTNAFIQQLVDVSELLVKRDNGYQFAHLSFQGYLAASEIIRIHKEVLLIKNWQESWWRETILLYAAQVNPNPFLKALINVGTSESVALAYDCIQETPRKVSPEIENELQELEASVSNLLFRDLQRYLSNREWRNADEETTRLMLQLGDDEDKGYLVIDDLRKFPRNELQVIDSLWVKYSNGKFGFSVQKKIWLDLGKLLGKSNINTWKNFCEHIGWRKDNEWLNHNDLTFNANALQGHFPWFKTLLLGSSKGGMRIDVDTFFSYLDSST